MQIDFQALPGIFNSTAPDLLKKLAEAARQTTRQYFGRAMVLYTPLYIANHCDNQCVYCGFNAMRPIERKQLSIEEIEAECRALSSTGIQNILILTGESSRYSPVAYIKEAVEIAKGYFPNIALEVYPLSVMDYQQLVLAGVDGLTIYQETYARQRYDQLHLAGPKTDYTFRYQTPERAAQAGMRSISLGALLGLSDWREDVSALFEHLRWLEKKYPGVDYLLSFPRLQKVAEDIADYHFVTDQEMLKIICVARLLFPRVGINLSTRENSAFRDRILEFGITRMSAGSQTTVGGYRGEHINAAQQFEVNDNRSVLQIKQMLLERGFDPVLTDWRRI